jgi:serine protease Do
LPEEDDTEARPDKADSEKTNRLGITIAALTEELMTEHNVTNGVLVTQIVNGPASRAGVRRGDIILSVDGNNIKGVKHFNELLEKLPAGKTVAMLVQRGGSPTFLAVRMPEDD